MILTSHKETRHEIRGQAMPFTPVEKRKSCGAQNKAVCARLWLELNKLVPPAQMGGSVLRMSGPGRGPDKGVRAGALALWLMGCAQDAAATLVCLTEARSLVARAICSGPRAQLDSDFCK
eukprot:3863325-Pleurochrysis_carterae.AAC.2